MYAMPAPPGIELAWLKYRLLSAGYPLKMGLIMTKKVVQCPSRRGEKSV
jgi:hypothetical protein